MKKVQTIIEFILATVGLLFLIWIGLSIVEVNVDNIACEWNIFHWLLESFRR